MLLQHAIHVVILGRFYADDFRAGRREVGVAWTLQSVHTLQKIVGDDNGELGQVVGATFPHA